MESPRTHTYLATVSEVDQLRNDILNATRTLDEEEPKFLPAGDIERLTARPRVGRVLRELGHENLVASIHDANRPAKKIFLILARAGMLPFIERVLSGNFSDHHLPMDISGVGNAFVMERAQHPSSSDNSTPERSTLGYHELDRFREQQWMFLSPVFGGNFHFSLKPGVPLPLIAKGEGIESGFSIVYKVEVHPSHIPGGPTGNLAMKQLSLETKERKGYLEKEMINLESVRELSNSHLIRPIAACTRGKQAFIFFPWAEGGNLLDFWKTTPSNGQNHIDWMLGQMVGLSQALELLAGRNCRHSDLKPQNILHFPDGSAAGTLVITDLGISKFHILATTKRWGPTSAKSVTVRYSPPEFDELKPDTVHDYIEGPDKRKLSRRFDIWSLGCVFVEFLIWARLGQSSFIDFNRSMETAERYWKRKPSRRNTANSPDSSKYVRHETVIKWFGKLKEAPRQTPDGAAVRGVLKLVEKHMLVIDCNGRYKASEVHERLQEILQAYRKLPSPLFAPAEALRPTGEYGLDVPLREQQVPTTDGPRALGAGSTGAGQPVCLEGLATASIPRDNAAAQRMRDEANGRPESQSYPRRKPLTSLTLTPSLQRQIAKLRDRWTVTTDNKFAQAFFSKVINPNPGERSTLCQVCSAFRIWEPGFTISGDVGGFNARSLTCNLCQVLYSVSKTAGLGDGEELRCVRNGSTMSTTGRENQPILSLFAAPGSNTHDLEFAQVGYPTLFPSDSPQQYRLFRQWLHVCDTEHGHKPEAYSGSPQMPTRLIRIRDSKEHLEVIEESSHLRYVALSHCWGNSPKLCTLTSNLEAFRNEIPHNLLPLNFQEAIRVTRALSIPYLWIDSLCIIQDDLEDWKREAGRMGQVFSNAYLTIAATSAAASDEGFLTRRTGSPLSAAIETPGGEILHVSEFMEDYHQDLELARLNTRGWVLQERALSRRTLHFTRTQVYWECGEGVHCERLFKLSNPQAAIFADSDFPQSILKQFKGGRITLFQHLYQTYSRLAFSQISDRPVAILGLEKRLLDAFQTRGGFGIFEVYLARSLLWSRQKDVFLSRIPYTKSRPPPSWSWMAYQGPITYMEVPFDQVDWTNDCVFPSDSEISTDARGPALKALARELTLTRLDFLHRVKLDQQVEIQASDLRGIVLGKDKHRESREPMHYVLLITLSGEQSERKRVYVRAGVAWLFEHNIAPDAEEVEVY